MSVDTYRPVALLVLLLSVVQVLFFTTIKGLPPLTNIVSQPGAFFGNWRFYLVGVCAALTLLISVGLVVTSKSALVLAMAYQANNILMGFILLPLTWRLVYSELVFTSTSRVLAYLVLSLSATGVALAAYLWNRDVPI